MAQDYDRNYKFIILGDAAVGKSSLLLQFTEAKHQVSYITTIGTDFKVKILNLDGCRHKLHLWDTAGQERFRTIVTTYYRGAQGALIVYDVTNEDSFHHVRSWLHELHQNCIGATIIIVGNKCDQTEDQTVPTEAGEEFAREHGLAFYETSAKENINVHEVFEDLTRQVYKAELEARSMDISDFNSAVDVNDNNSVKETKPCC
ncbi:ras-related protein Rab-35-like [Dendronephthya gigantea]|uniref:ras-related protein Rab-35-like n=1 Tax=Dendronephthya gigantea TaxID=151771 RepID=UPI001069D834|nr:ras-related protein Rab-35-like [Dendronephthya gigantea]